MGGAVTRSWDMMVAPTTTRRGTSVQTATAPTVLVRAARLRVEIPQRILVLIPRASISMERVVACFKLTHDLRLAFQMRHTIAMR